MPPPYGTGIITMVINCEADVDDDDENDIGWSCYCHIF